MHTEHSTRYRAKSHTAANGSTKAACAAQTIAGQQKTCLVAKTCRISCTSLMPGPVDRLPVPHLVAANRCDERPARSRSGRITKKCSAQDAIRIWRRKSPRYQLCIRCSDAHNLSFRQLVTIQQPPQSPAIVEASKEQCLGGGLLVAPAGSEKTKAEQSTPSFCLNPPLVKRMNRSEAETPAPV